MGRCRRMGSWRHGWWSLGVVRGGSFSECHWWVVVTGASEVGVELARPALRGGSTVAGAAGPGGVEREGVL